MRRTRNKRKRQLHRNKVTNFIKKRALELNENLPKSEVWFWSLYKNQGYALDSDKPNVPWGFWIFDVKNDKYKYVIEIQDPSHKKKAQKIKDKVKKDYAIKNGYYYLSIRAWSLMDYTRAIECLKNYCG